MKGIPQHAQQTAEQRDAEDAMADLDHDPGEDLGAGPANSSPYDFLNYEIVGREAEIITRRSLKSQVDESFVEHVSDGFAGLDDLRDAIATIAGLAPDGEWVIEIRPKQVETPPEPEKPKRKRRGPAEMAAARARGEK